MISIICCRCGHPTPVTPDLGIRVGVVDGATEIVWDLPDGSHHVAINFESGSIPTLVELITRAVTGWPMPRAEYDARVQADRDRVMRDVFG